MGCKKMNLRLYYAVVFLQGMVFYAPIATLYRQAKGLSVFDITLIESLSLLLMILLEIPLGFVADKIGYKKTIAACNALFFLSKIVFWQAQGFGMFLAERLILSVVFAGLSGCDSAYLYLSAEEGESQRVFGVYQAMSTAGIIVASVVFSVFIKSDYQLSALLTVAAYGLAMALSLFLPEIPVRIEERKPIRVQLKEIVCTILGNKRFLLFLMAAAMIAQSSQTITVFLNQLQYLRSGIPMGFMGYLYILVTVASLVSALSHRVTERFGEAKTMNGLFIAAGVSCAVMAFVANPAVSVAGILILRVAASLASPISMDIQNRQVAISDRATVLSVYSMAMDGVAVGTNIIFGRIADFGVGYAMGAGSAFCILGLALYMIWHRMKGLNNHLPVR